MLECDSEKKDIFLRMCCWNDKKKQIIRYRSTNNEPAEIVVKLTSKLYGQVIE